MLLWIESQKLQSLFTDETRETEKKKEIDSQLKNSVFVLGVLVWRFGCLERRQI